MNSNILKECALSEPCSYIDGLNQTLEYKIIINASTKECEDYILRGWRRFGAMYFRPICQGCFGCQSLKIDVENFTFSKSQRRILRKNSDIDIVVRRPSITTDHLMLFEKYHKFKHATRDWDKHNTSISNYHSSFVHEHGDFGYEILYFDDKKLIAVDLIDLLESGISSLYCYYDPDYNHLSLGHYTLLRQIMLAKELKLPWIYLGYYVKESQSLSYKATYEPLLELDGRPDSDDTPIWREFISH